MGDGHCLLHSICESLAGQYSDLTQVGYNELKALIRSEVMNNTTVYLPAIDDNDIKRLKLEMDNYLDYKLYNSSFGDMVPLILAQILSMDLLIIVEERHGFFLSCVEPRNRRGEVQKCVFIYKRGDHYNGIVPKNKMSGAIETTSSCNKYESPYFINPESQGMISNGCEDHQNCIKSCDQTSVGNDVIVQYKDAVKPSNNTCYSSAGKYKVAAKNDGNTTCCGTGCLYGKDTDASVGKSKTDRNIRICSWNINGLTKAKLDDRLLGRFLKEFDIILLQETWLSENDELELEGYTSYSFPRKIKHANAKRDSGGLAALVKNGITQGIEIGKIHEDLIMWLRLKKHETGLSRDICIGNIYIPPEHSTHLQCDPFVILQDHIALDNNDCDWVLCGDLNARTGNQPEYNIEEIDGTDGLELSNLLQQANIEQCAKIRDMYAKGLLNRCSKDKSTPNGHGKQLIAFCKTTNMLMLNGRCGSDAGVGMFTRSDTTGDSVVDYVLCSPDIYDCINDFAIGTKYPESDHLPLVFSIRCDTVKSDHSDGVSDVKDWSPYCKYVWSHDDITVIRNNLMDDITQNFHSQYKKCMVDMLGTDDVAKGLNAYVSQAIDRVCTKQKSGNKRKPNGAPWFDRECRRLRAEAVTAGERVTNESERQDMLNKCRSYRSCKQRKRRDYRNKCIKRIESDFNSGNGNIWNTLNEFSSNVKNTNMPQPQKFMEHFEKLSRPMEAEYFNHEYEKEAIRFLQRYDAGIENMDGDNRTELDILNSNFTQDEIECAIDKLKNNKSPGLDSIPAEIIKSCKEQIGGDILEAFNYIIEKRDFPDSWAQGLRSPIFKAGDVKDVHNYRGITILSIFGKLFETAVLNRLTFVNESFRKVDINNNGFLNGKRTADNIFILQGLIERQLLMGKPLFVCYVDFSKAFDLVNRHILFFKIMKSGWHGRVIDTMRSLYRKTYFRLKSNGYVSPPVLDTLGVNQGGSASGLLFRKYLSDLGEYLKKEVGICIDDEILAHLLFADDLILVSDTPGGLQKQLDGLYKFCADNLMIVNEIKTKVTVFGNVSGFEDTQFCFNGKTLDNVVAYKYLGNIIKQIKTASGDIFGKNYEMLCNKARGAIFGIYKKIRNIGVLSPKIMGYLFESAVKPILVYGSEIWGHSKTGTAEMDKVFLWYMRCVLRVKRTTCNNIIYGECGMYPPSTTCHENILCYYNRLCRMNDFDITKKVFNTLCKLHDQGFTNWISRVCELARKYNVDINDTTSEYSLYKRVCKDKVQQSFRCRLYDEIQDTEKNPIMRTYRRLKSDFGTEPYLYLVTNAKYRNAISKIRTSSHHLEIERGRHCNPRIPIEQRLCTVCNVVESEQHFILSCAINESLRHTFIQQIQQKYTNFTRMSDDEKFVFIFSVIDPQILTWLGKFIHSSLQLRQAALNSALPRPNRVHCPAEELVIRHRPSADVK